MTSAKRSSHWASGSKPAGTCQPRWTWVTPTGASTAWGGPGAGVSCRGSRVWAQSALPRKRASGNTSPISSPSSPASVGTSPSRRRVMFEGTCRAATQAWADSRESACTAPGRASQCSGVSSGYSLRRRAWLPASQPSSCCSNARVCRVSRVRSRVSSSMPARGSASQAPSLRSASRSDPAGAVRKEMIASGWTTTSPRVPISTPPSGSPSPARDQGRRPAIAHAAPACASPSEASPPSTTAAIRTVPLPGRFTATTRSPLPKHRSAASISHGEIALSARGAFGNPASAAFTISIQSMFPPSHWSLLHRTRDSGEALCRTRVRCTQPVGQVGASGWGWSLLLSIIGEFLAGLGVLNDAYETCSRGFGAPLGFPCKETPCEPHFSSP